MTKEILDKNAINKAVTRISFEIIEQNKDLSSVILIGIKTRGIYLAKRISKKIAELEGINIPAGEIDIKLYRDDQHQINHAVDPMVSGSKVNSEINHKHVILVDDVIFTGRTIRAAFDAVFDLGRPDKISLVELIDRGHRELPIRPDFVGKNVPTSLNEEVHVQMVEVDDTDAVIISQNN